jgi:branched-chain amino acid transport system substrate-binding protein
MTTRRQFLISAATLSSALALNSCGSLLQSSSSSSGPIVFGVGGPFTGDNAEYGIIWRNAFNIALDEINAKGGINGRNIQLIYEDTQADPKQSVPVAQKFVNNDSVLAELGDFSSPSSMAASPIYERAHLVQFGFTNSDPRFTLGGDYMFSTSATQQVSAAYMAQSAVSSLQGKNQAVLYLDTSWGQITEGIYANKAKALGANIVAAKSYLSTEKDFRPLLLQVRAANPDLIALISYYNDAALIVQQAKEVGITSKIFAAGSAYSPNYLSEAGSAAEGTIVVAEFLLSDPRPNVQAFIKKYEARYHTTPDSFAEGAYDALNVLIWAVQKGGATREGIQKALVSGTDIPSLQFGPFKFGPDRRVAGDSFKQYLTVVKNGQFTLLNS